jgi:hypothetical protein
MPLYLDELWLNWDSPASAKRSLAAFQPMANPGFAWPESVTLVAGPWFSNEEAKIVLVLDIADHAKTFPSFTLGVAHGLIARRRLTPLVTWDALGAVLDRL